MRTPSPDTSRRTGAPGPGGTPQQASMPPARAGRKRPIVLVVTAVALAAAAGFAARGLSGPAPPGTSAQNVPVSTATVVRTDVSARQLVAGTLGYRGAFSVIDELGAGIITWLPSAGSIVTRGQMLFQVAGQPVILLYGPVPAWRDFGPGMTPGPDVRELQRNLTAIGFDPGPADGQFGWATEAAIERWQSARGLTVTGTIRLGQVTFLPGPLRITGTPVPLGTPAAPGAPVLSGTSDTPAVTVSLTVGGPTIRPGDPVLVTMPDGTTTVTGMVASVGRVASIPSGSGSDASAQGGGGSSTAVIPVTITVGKSQIPAGLDQAPVQVAITQQRDSNVLAVPVTALLALPGGGYAVRVTGPGPRLIPVTTGVFDNATGLVEVTGPGLAAGQTVEAAQG
jgi:peptidoglycan hydrolase-like protein with peptidoglycan-binding domain